MAKEHKKLYKAGKNWVVATLIATTITLLGGIGAYSSCRYNNREYAIYSSGRLQSILTKQQLKQFSCFKSACDNAK